GIEASPPRRLPVLALLVGVVAAAVSAGVWSVARSRTAGVPDPAWRPLDPDEKKPVAPREIEPPKIELPKIEPPKIEPPKPSHPTPPDPAPGHGSCLVYAVEGDPTCVRGWSSYLAASTRSSVYLWHLHTQKRAGLRKFDAPRGHVVLGAFRE